MWSDDPSREAICEATAEEVILIKDRHGKVIGFERLNVALEAEGKGTIALEAMSI